MGELPQWLVKQQCSEIRVYINHSFLLRCVVGRNCQANEQLLGLASEGSCAQLWVVTAAKCAGHVEGHLATHVRGIVLL